MTRKFTFFILAMLFAILGPGTKAWGQEQTVTMSYSGSSTTNMTGGNDAATVGLNASSWSVIGDKGGNSNFPGLNKAGQIRLYGADTNHNVITVTNSDGATITSIAVTYGNKSNNNAKVTVDGTEVTGTGSDTEKNYNINSSSFSIAHNYSNTTQVYILSVVINYSASSTPSITVTDNVTLDYDATEGQFDYSISNPTTGVNMTASTEDSWISNIIVNASNVTFTTTENETSSQRVGTIILSYTGATSKDVTVTQAAAPQEGVLFYESFDTNDGTGGNDDQWSGTIASNTLTYDNDGWTVANANGAYKCAKFGTGSKKGSAQTPTISLSGNATLIFKAAAWNGSSESTTLNISATNATLSQASVTLAKGAWTEYSINITNVTNSTQITFEANIASNNRFFLDEVKVLEAEAPSVATPTFSLEAGTYTEAQTVIIECETEGATIYYTTDGTTPTDGSTPYTDAITVSETTTIKAIAYLNGEASDIATAEYEIVELYTITVFPNAFSVVTTSPADEAAAGTEVTINISNIEEHYHVTEIIVQDEYLNVVPVDDNGKFIMPAHNVWVSVSFEEDQQCYISYYCNGLFDDGETIYAGPIGNLREPSELYFPEGFTFAGWSTSMASTTPITETYNITENTELFAIFAREEGGSGATTWNLVTDASQISAGDIIKIAATASGANNSDNNGTFAADGIISSSIMGKVNASINNNQLTDEGAAEFTIGGTASEWTLSNGNGELLGATEAKKIAWDEGTTTWTISIDIDNDAKASISNTETGYGTILYNRDNPRFTTYTSAPNVAMVLPQIFVKTISTVTHYYTRVFQRHIVLDDITIEGPSIIPAGSTLNMDDYTLTNTNPANLLIEDGAQLIQNSSNVMAIVRKNITGYGAGNEQTRDGYYLIANPTARAANDEYDAFNADECAQFDLYTFNPAVAREWVNIGTTSQRVTFERNIGYLFASANNTTMNFRGSLLATDETTEIRLVKAEAGAGIDFPGFNLIGNPYACNAYPTDEDGNFMRFYKMNEDGNELELVENVEAIAPCQGFFVEANANEDKVIISTTAPATASQAMSLTVSQNRGNVIDRAIVNFNGSSNLHKFMMNPAHTNLSIAKGGETFAAISTEAEGELPVNFKAEKNGTYTITVNTENVEAEYLHLIDNLTGMDTDLLSTPSYTFDAKTSDYASRFKLVFGMKDDNEEMSQASSFAYINNGEIVISNEGRATLQVIDVMGRIVRNEEINGECRISTNGLTAGLYILNLNGNVQKIVVR